LRRPIEEEQLERDAIAQLRLGGNDPETRDSG